MRRSKRPINQSGAACVDHETHSFIFISRVENENSARYGTRSPGFLPWAPFASASELPSPRRPDRFIKTPLRPSAPVSRPVERQVRPRRELRSDARTRNGNVERGVFAEFEYRFARPRGSGTLTSGCF